MFDGLFRRDENFWDYSSLANPLNPAAPPSTPPLGSTRLLMNRAIHSVMIFATLAWFRFTGDQNSEVKPVNKEEMQAVIKGILAVTLEQGVRRKFDEPVDYIHACQR